MSEIYWLIIQPSIGVIWSDGLQILGWLVYIGKFSVIDTHPHISKILRESMMNKTGEERLKMGFSMVEFSRKLVESSIRFSEPGISELALKQKMLSRFYGHDFEKPELEKILHFIEQTRNHSQ